MRYYIKLLVINGVKLYLHSFSSVDIVLVSNSYGIKFFDSRDDALHYINSMPDNFQKLNWQIEKV